jgi:hypothetical protein
VFWKYEKEGWRGKALLLANFEEKAGNIGNFEFFRSCKLLKMFNFLDFYNGCGRIDL